MKPGGLGEKNLQGILYLWLMGFSHVTIDETVTQLYFHLALFFLRDEKI